MGSAAQADFPCELEFLSECLENATGNANRFAGEVLGVRGRQVDSGRRNVVRLADTAEERLGFAWVDGIDANLAFAQSLARVPVMASTAALLAE